MDKLLQMLGVDKLDESKQSEIKGQLDEIVDVKVKEKLAEEKEQQKEELKEHYEQKFEEYKQEITEKFSDFVDSVLDEELQIPEKVYEYARKGELYEDAIETLKVKMAIDEGVLEEEARGLMKEAKSEIESLEEDNNKLMKENMDLKRDAKDFSAYIYLREKCDGLTPQETDKVIKILEGVKDKAEIDRKFDLVVESIRSDDDENEVKDFVCESCEKTFTLKESDEKKCECGAKLTEKTEDGKGKQNLNEDSINNNDEDNDPFNRLQEMWSHHLNRL